MGFLDRVKSATKSAGETVASKASAEVERRAALAGGASLDWPQLTHLAPSVNGVQHVMGESNYQKALDRAGNGKSYSGPNRPMVVAELVLDPKNKYDKNAVRVEVAGQLVGFIPREDAPSYHAPIRTLRKAGRRATTAATITGGWDRGGSDTGSFGIVLHCRPDVRTDVDPFLPRAKRLNITTLADGIDEGWLFHGGGKGVTTLGALSVDGERVLLTISDCPVGWATPKASAPVIPILHAVAAAGLPATATVVAERPSTTKSRPFDVRAYVPDT